MRVEVVLPGSADSGGEGLQGGGAPPATITAAELASDDSRAGACSVRRGRLPFQARVLVLLPLVAFVQPRILPLQPVPFTFDPVEAVPQ